MPDQIGLQELVPKAAPFRSTLGLDMYRWRPYQIPRRYSTKVTPNPLPATFLRGGTSKGIFIKRSDLPDDRAEWDRIFLGIMGSPDPYGRQLNGMGGGISSLSKINVVGPPVESMKSSVDAEYTFVQVGIRDSSIDYSGNCGNLSSMVGVFAVDEGICAPPEVVKGSHSTVRMFNTNTNKHVSTTFPVSHNGDDYVPELNLQQVSMAGVSGQASQITLDFISPGGARTGKLLPTGNAIDTIELHSNEGSTTYRASLVDATNPTVLISSTDLRQNLSILPGSPINFTSDTVLAILEAIRQSGARLMSLDPSAQAQPKIAILSDPISYDNEVDVFVHALSMGVLHKAVPMTVGLCVGVAAGIKDTLAWEIIKRSHASSRAAKGELIRIEHPGGTVDVGAEFGPDGDVKSAKVVRTGRRLMKGVVWW